MNQPPQSANSPRRPSGTTVALAALAVTISLNVAALIWGAAILSATVTQLQGTVTKLDGTLGSLGGTVQDLRERVRVIEDRQQRGNVLPGGLP